MALLSNLFLHFGLYQGPTQDTTTHLGYICNLVSCWKSGVQEFSIPLVNLIAVHQLDLSWYQKVLVGYEFGSLGWFSKDLDDIETELVLIDQLRGYSNPRRWLAPSPAMYPTADRTPQHRLQKYNQATHSTCPTKSSGSV